MQRSAGVTSIAILTFLGSLFTLALAALVCGISLMTFKGTTLPNSRGELPLQQPGVRTMLLGAVLVYVLPGIWGMITGVGLWKLKEWARISTIIFSVLLGVSGVFLLLAAVIMPFPTMPQQPQPVDMAIFMRVFLGALSLGTLAISAWWLIYLSRKSVQAQFSGAAMPIPAQPYAVSSGDLSLNSVPTRPAVAGRPVSITVIAILVLLGAVFYPIALLMHSPLMILGFMVRGAAAMAVHSIFALANLYIGIGLLKLWREARVVAIVWFLFAIVNVSVSFFGRGASERFAELLKEQPQLIGSTPEMVFPHSFLIVIGVGTILMALAQIYFLVTRRSAFEAATT